MGDVDCSGSVAIVSTWEDDCFAVLICLHCFAGLLFFPGLLGFAGESTDNLIGDGRVDFARSWSSDTPDVYALLRCAGLSGRTDEVPGRTCDSAVLLRLSSDGKPSVTWLQDQTWLLSVSTLSAEGKCQTGSFFKLLQAVHAADNPKLPWKGKIKSQRAQDWITSWCLS